MTPPHTEYPRERRSGLSIPKWFVALMMLLVPAISGIAGASASAALLWRDVAENKQRNDIQDARLTQLEGRRVRDILLDYRLCRIEAALKIEGAAPTCRISDQP